MFNRRAILCATILILLCTDPGFAAKGGPVSYDTPTIGYLYPFNSDPYYHMGGDALAPYENGVDGIRSVFNGGDYLLDLDSSRSATPRISWINLGEPAVYNGTKPPPMAIWSNSTMNLKVADIQNLNINSTGYAIAWFDMASENGKRWYRVFFNGNYGSTKVNVTRPGLTEWNIEAPKGSIARVFDVTTGKSTLIGNYYVDFQLKVTLP